MKPEIKNKKLRNLYAFIAANPKATHSDYVKSLNTKIACMQGEF